MDKALVMAGGEGTRLRSAIGTLPKPMAPVGGRPFLEYLLDYWIDQGVKTFILSIGYKAKLIKDHFGKSYSGANISYVEELSPLGTGGAIKKALEELDWKNENILLINGDTWFEVDLCKFSKDVVSSGKPITVALKAIDSNTRYSAVLCEDGVVIKFGSRVNGPCLINGGCYSLAINFLLKYLDQYSGKFSFEDDVLPGLALGNKITGSVQDGKFLDIGIPEDYRKAIDVIEFKKRDLKKC
jgi:D-glycero-alpha-D-manno-heptose 1-phosphate guanylyltransferase